ncbi:ribosome maturation factor RimM [Nitrospira sp. Kam-Ns4a]
MGDSTELIAIGQILKPFGVRGDVWVRSLSDVPGRFERLRRVTIEAPTGRTLVTAVQRVRADKRAPGTYVVGLEAVTSPEQAAAWRGGLLKIPKGEAPPLPDGQYYEFQLIGLTVQDETGMVLGTLEEIWETGAHHVFAVRRDDREILVPAAKQVVAAVDLARRTMTIRRLEGLLDDEAPVRAMQG